MSHHGGGDSGHSCHKCKNKKSQTDLVYCGNSHLDPKSGRVCRKKFCFNCLGTSCVSFVQDILDSGEDINKWECISCRDLCSCATCNRKKTKSATKPKKVLVNPSTSRMKPKDAINNHLLQLYTRYTGHEIPHLMVPAADTGSVSSAETNTASGGGGGGGRNGMMAGQSSSLDHSNDSKPLGGPSSSKPQRVQPTVRTRSTRSTTDTTHHHSAFSDGSSLPMPPVPVYPAPPALGVGGMPPSTAPTYPPSQTQEPRRGTSLYLALARHTNNHHHNNHHQVADIRPHPVESMFGDHTSPLHPTNSSIAPGGGHNMTSSLTVPQFLSSTIINTPSIPSNMPGISDPATHHQQQQQQQQHGQPVDSVPPQNQNPHHHHHLHGSLQSNQMLPSSHPFVSTATGHSVVTTPHVAGLQPSLHNNPLQKQQQQQQQFHSQAPPGTSSTTTHHHLAPPTSGFHIPTPASTASTTTAFPSQSSSSTNLHNYHQTAAGKMPIRSSSLATPFISSNPALTSPIRSNSNSGLTNGATTSIPTNIMQYTPFASNPTSTGGPSLVATAPVGSGLTSTPAITSFSTSLASPMASKAGSRFQTTTALAPSLSGSGGAGGGGASSIPFPAISPSKSLASQLSTATSASTSNHLLITAASQHVQTSTPFLFKTASGSSGFPSLASPSNSQSQIGSAGRFQLVSTLFGPNTHPPLTKAPSQSNARTPNLGLKQTAPGGPSPFAALLVDHQLAKHSTANVMMGGTIAPGGTSELFKPLTALSSSSSSVVTPSHPSHPGPAVLPYSTPNHHYTTTPSMYQLPGSHPHPTGQLSEQEKSNLLREGYPSTPALLTASHPAYVPTKEEPSMPTEPSTKTEVDQNQIAATPLTRVLMSTLEQYGETHHPASAHLKQEQHSASSLGQPQQSLLQHEQGVPLSASAVSSASMSMSDLGSQRPPHMGEMTGEQQLTPEEITELARSELQNEHLLLLNQQKRQQMMLLKQQYRLHETQQQELRHLLTRPSKSHLHAVASTPTGGPSQPPTYNSLLLLQSVITPKELQADLDSHRRLLQPIQLQLQQYHDKRRDMDKTSEMDGRGLTPVARAQRSMAGLSPMINNTPLTTPKMSPYPSTMSDGLQRMSTSASPSAASVATLASAVTAVSGGVTTASTVASHDHTRDPTAAQSPAIKPLAGLSSLSLSRVNSFSNLGNGSMTPLLTTPRFHGRDAPEDFFQTVLPQMHAYVSRNTQFYEMNHKTMHEYHSNTSSSSSSSSSAPSSSSSSSSLGTSSSSTNAPNIPRPSITISEDNSQRIYDPLLFPPPSTLRSTTTTTTTPFSSNQKDDDLDLPPLSESFGNIGSFSPFVLPNSPSLATKLQYTQLQERFQQDPTQQNEQDLLMAQHQYLLEQQIGYVKSSLETTEREIRRYHLDSLLHEQSLRHLLASPPANPSTAPTGDAALDPIAAVSTTQTNTALNTSSLTNPPHKTHTQPSHLVMDDYFIKQTELLLSTYERSLEKSEILLPLARPLSLAASTIGATDAHPAMAEQGHPQAHPQAQPLQPSSHNDGNKSPFLKTPLFETKSSASAVSNASDADLTIEAEREALLLKYHKQVKQQQFLIDRQQQYLIRRQNYLYRMRMAKQYQNGLFTEQQHLQLLQLLSSSSSSSSAHQISSAHASPGSNAIMHPPLLATSSSSSHRSTPTTTSRSTPTNYPLSPRGLIPGASPLHRTASGATLTPGLTPAVPIIANIPLDPSLLSTVPGSGFEDTRHYGMDQTLHYQQHENPDKLKQILSRTVLLDQVTNTQPLIPKEVISSLQQAGGGQGAGAGGDQTTTEQVIHPPETTETIVQPSHQSFSSQESLSDPTLLNAQSASSPQSTSDPQDASATTTTTTASTSSSGSTTTTAALDSSLKISPLFALLPILDNLDLSHLDEHTRESAKSLLGYLKYKSSLVTTGQRKRGRPPNRRRGNKDILFKLNIIADFLCEVDQDELLCSSLDVLFLRLKSWLERNRTMAISESDLNLVSSFIRAIREKYLTQQADSNLPPLSAITNAKQNVIAARNARGTPSTGPNGTPRSGSTSGRATPKRSSSSSGGSASGRRGQTDMTPLAIPREGTPSFASQSEDGMNDTEQLDANPVISMRATRSATAAAAAASGASDEHLSQKGGFSHPNHHIPCARNVVAVQMIPPTVTAVPTKGGSVAPPLTARNRALVSRLQQQQQRNAEEMQMHLAQREQLLNQQKVLEQQQQRLREIQQRRLELSALDQNREEYYSLARRLKSYRQKMSTGLPILDPAAYSVSHAAHSHALGAAQPAVPHGGALPPSHPTTASQPSRLSKAEAIWKLHYDNDDTVELTNPAYHVPPSSTAMVLKNGAPIAAGATRLPGLNNGPVDMVEIELEPRPKLILTHEDDIGIDLTWALPSSLSQFNRLIRGDTEDPDLPAVHTWNNINKKEFENFTVMGAFKHYDNYDQTKTSRDLESSNNRSTPDVRDDGRVTVKPLFTHACILAKKKKARPKPCSGCPSLHGLPGCDGASSTSLSSNCSSSSANSVSSSSSSSSGHASCHNDGIPQGPDDLGDAAIAPLPLESSQLSLLPPLHPHQSSSNIMGPKCSPSSVNPTAMQIEPITVDVASSPTSNPTEEPDSPEEKFTRPIISSSVVRIRDGSTRLMIQNVDDTYVLPFFRP